MAGATWNCCCLSVFCVHHTPMRHTMSLHAKHTRKMHAFLAVTCYLHFWQNDQAILHATVVMRLNLTLSLPWCHLKTTSKRVKFQILRHFSFRFHITRERVGIKTHRTKWTFVTGPGKYTVCRRVRALSSLEISQAWGVKGLSWLSRVSTFALRHCLSLFHICCCSYCSLVDLEKGLSLSHCSWKTVCGRVWRTPTSSFPWPSQLKILLSSTSCLGRTVMTMLCRRRLAGRKVHEICTVSSAVNFTASPSLPHPQQAK